MQKLFLVIVMMLCVAAMGFSQSLAQNPTAAELLQRIDDNEIFSTIEYEGEMIIEHGGRRFVKTMRVWARGNTHSFIEFTNPEDRGTRYLRRDNRLFVYSPDIEDVMLISGHMLRESMMGSDMSYEDALDNESLSSRYTPVIFGSDVLNGRDVWILELTETRRGTQSYPRRKLWIDKETGDLLRAELFALSGAKLKVYNVLRIEVHGDRRFPVEVEVRDLLRRNSRTVFIMRNVVLDRPIPDSIFTDRNLRR
ncbi:MAG: outer membrane lipoprotein-sorting protein [Spirochaetes bacterium]|nr:outer membrane lipoprotein-sorting protein [Spirochaetota bacterium]